MSTGVDAMSFSGNSFQIKIAKKNVYLCRFIESVFLFLAEAVSEISTGVDACLVNHVGYS